MLENHEEQSLHLNLANALTLEKPSTAWYNFHFRNLKNKNLALIGMSCMLIAWYISWRKFWRDALSIGWT